MSKWFEQTDCTGSNVVYSRVRLARNWDEYAFPAKLDQKQAQELLERLKEGLKEIGGLDGNTYVCRDLNQIKDLERSEDEASSLILGGDDHIRIQLLYPGLNLDELWARMDRMDDYVNERFSYAFDDKYGYLTSFPTNVGTGLRACVVLHLPVLSQVRKFQSIVADMSRFGTAIRGLYGEGSDNYGSMYEVSNQRTLGQSEREIIDLVTKAAAQLNNQEQRVRKAALSSQRLEREDEAWKSYGVLRYARRIAEKDARIFLSQLMAGEADGLLKFETPCSIYSMILGIKPANLRLSADRPLEKEELDQARAAYIREHLPEIVMK